MSENYLEKCIELLSEELWNSQESSKTWEWAQTNAVDRVNEIRSRIRECFLKSGLVSRHSTNVLVSGLDMRFKSAFVGK